MVDRDVEDTFAVEEVFWNEERVTFVAPSDEALDHNKICYSVPNSKAAKRPPWLLGIGDGIDSCRMTYPCTAEKPGTPSKK